MSNSSFLIDVTSKGSVAELDIAQAVYFSVWPVGTERRLVMQSLPLHVATASSRPATRLARTPPRAPAFQQASCRARPLGRWKAPGRACKIAEDNSARLTYENL